MRVEERGEQRVEEAMSDQWSFSFSISPQVVQLNPCFCGCAEQNMLKAEKSWGWSDRTVGRAAFALYTQLIQV